MDQHDRLIDDDMTPAEDSHDVFADEFEVDNFGGVADGFRPRQDEQESSHSTSDSSSHEAPALQSRNSTRKSMARDNPFASPEDDEREPTLTFEPTHDARRSVSSASSRMFARTSSPRLTSGPSHPYGMYPQGTLARTASVATTSTIRAPLRQSSDLPTGPQHPYALYPQNVEEHEDDDEEHMSQTVGFPGLGRGYRRQRGPDGEEQDIIGEDGHAEQLPPYSRYPEDGPEKIPLLGVPATPTPLRSRAPVAGSDPGMPLVHQRLLPTPSAQPQSMSDESALVRQETRQSLSSSGFASNSLASHKTWGEKSWEEKRKTRLWGIPVWCYILAACVAGFVAAVLGGVIGGFVMGAHKHHPEISKASNTTSSLMGDASAIATPTAAPPPTGTYALSMSTPQDTNAACLTVPDQQAAWTCELGGAPGIAIDVAWNESAKALGASLLYASNSTQISYGSQLSWMETNFNILQSVEDVDSPASGAAWYFQTTYDKLVVLPESALNASAMNDNNKKAKRQQKFTLDTSWFLQKTVTQPGEKPWFCVWNNTVIEGFIYIQETVNPTYTASSSPSSSTSASSTSVWSAVSTSWYSNVVAKPTAVYHGTYTTPASSYATGSQHSPWTSSSAGYGDDDDNDGDDDDDSQAQTTSSYRRKRQNSQDLYETLQVYPYIVKIEERRVSGNTLGPYCQQYQMMDNSDYNPVNWPGTEINIVVQLEEVDPTPAAYASAAAAGSINKRLVMDECHCQWMSGQ